MKTINGVNVKYGGQSNGAFECITATDLGLNQNVVGYIYETDQERGYICLIEGKSDKYVYSNIMPLEDAREWTTEQVGRMVTGDNGLEANKK